MADAETASQGLWCGTNCWYFGVVMAIVACFISNLGVNLQKKAHLNLLGKSEQERRGYNKQATWKLGLLLIALGSIADFVALGFAPQSLVAPLGSFTLVSNVFLAPLLLKEKVFARSIIATAIIVLGSTISVSFASHTVSASGLSNNIFAHFAAFRGRVGRRVLD